MYLGAGRESLSDVIDHAVGVELLKKRGDRVDKGEPLAIMHYNRSERMNTARELITQAFQLGSSALPPIPLILDVIRGA
jgi:thymidine phosphorylase